VLALTWRAGLALCMAFYVLCMYGLARAEIEGVGLRPGTVTLAALFALLMMVPLVWIVAIMELPELWRGVRARRRWKLGRCPACGYDIHGSLASECPECGAGLGLPPEHRFGWRTLRRFLLVALVTWIAGSAACESWAIFDERAFAGEVRARLAAGADAVYWRERSWPCDGAWLIYEPGKGISAGRSVSMEAAR
jgi:hypothetical protein